MACPIVPVARLRPGGKHLKHLCHACHGRARFFLYPHLPFLLFPFPHGLVPPSLVSWHCSATFRRSEIVPSCGNYQKARRIKSANDNIAIALERYTSI